jgi:hypothetical protein
MKAFPVTAAAKSAFKQVQVLPCLPAEILRDASPLAETDSRNKADETDLATLALREHSVPAQNAPRISPS